MSIPIWMLIPFVAQLLTIALAPFLFGHWWEKNRNKFVVSIALSVPVVFYMLYAGMIDKIEHQVIFDYLPFIVLLGSLFIITGGIYVSGDIAAKPSVNTLFLGIGYLLASLMGTTGAAMLLIRPIIRTNSQRKYKTHTVLFFIAMVANCGGLLTPIGDPPLFLLYLRGVEFTWFLKLMPEWLFVGTILLVLYYITDRHYFKKEDWTAISADLREKEPVRTKGNINFIYLLGVVLSVAFINSQYIPAMAQHDAPIYIKFLREFVLVAMILLSIFTTKKQVRLLNKFTWHPILEVVAVFLGIFVTMTPALIFLNSHASDLGLFSQWHFYYSTGFVSAFLDNAPTSLAFYSVAQGLISDGNIVAGVSELLLIAISISSVFFGAMTYIGNGPNFMVKSIAEENGVPMPSFFGYILKFSFVVLLPVYVVCQLIFL